jgi:serine/threonine-protein kinase RsbW
MAERCTWQFAPNSDSVALARSAVAEFAVTCGFYRQIAEDIKLAVGEACNNAVEHGAPNKPFAITCSYADDALIVDVDDQGQGFELRPATSQQRDLMQSRGLGIFLMRKLMDRVDCQLKPGDGMQVTLEKRKVRAAQRMSG